MTSGAVIAFSPRTSTSCVSDVVTVTGFERSLKYSLHLQKVSSLYLSETTFWSLKDLAMFHFLPAHGGTG